MSLQKGFTLPCTRVIYIMSAGQATLHLSRWSDTLATKLNKYKKNDEEEISVSLQKLFITTERSYPPYRHGKEEEM